MKEVEAVLINCTPHDVTFMGEDGKTLALPKAPFATEARVGDDRIALGFVVDGSMGQSIRIRVNRKIYDRKGAAHIPARRPGHLYVVSTITAQAFPDRDDFLVPDEIVRDDRGEVTGCRALAQLWPPTNQVVNETLTKARREVVVPHLTETQRGG